MYLQMKNRPTISAGTTPCRTKAHIHTWRLPKPREIRTLKVLHMTSGGEHYLWSKKVLPMTTMMTKMALPMAWDGEHHLQLMKSRPEMIMTTQMDPSTTWDGE